MMEIGSKIKVNGAWISARCATVVASAAAVAIREERRAEQVYAEVWTLVARIETLAARMGR